MFEEMINELNKSTFIPHEMLLKRFQAAVTKKIGILKQPRSVRTGDEKINPSSKHLLWAAVLLEDIDCFELVRGIIGTELQEDHKAKGESISHQEFTSLFNNNLLGHLKELLAINPDANVNQNLSEKINKVYPAAQL